MSSISSLDPKSLFSNLNQKQVEAVQSVNSSTLVIAGAGSGKTAVLTTRVAYLMALGQVPGEILCLTFTNKAAKEMNERVSKLVQNLGLSLPFVPVWQNDYQTRPLLCTFHSLGVRVLREFGHIVGLNSSFSILDMDDQKKVVKEILKELNVDQKNLQPSLALYFISKCKQELLRSGESRKLSQDFLPIFHQIYQKYEQKLQSNQVVDFDDLILLTYIILKDSVEAQKTLQSRWKHILVDEFQDTNPVQFELIKLLIPPKESQNPDKSLFVVGDDAQSIYGFRGSKVEIILDFHLEYPQTKEIILNQNYRSTQPILDLAEKVLSHNPKQKKKELFTENEEKISVKYYLARNDQDEAEYIIKQLQKQYVNQEAELENEPTLEITDYFEKEALFLKPQKNLDPVSGGVSSMFDLYLEKEDFSPSSNLQSYHSTSWEIPKVDWSKVVELNSTVILYRTHAQSRSLEEVFIKRGLPYRLVSGTKFLDRKEVKDVLALLKISLNLADSMSLSRVLPLVLTGVGPKTLDQILVHLKNSDYPLSFKVQTQLDAFLAGVKDAFGAKNNLIDLTKELILASGYQKYLREAYPNKEEFEARMENIGELYSLMFPFDQGTDKDLRVRLEEFLAQISLMSQLDGENEDTIPKINLMSLHQSKGLEFETVFLVGIEDGLLPHQNSFFEKDGMQEEVRLAYVGVTRAKKYLHLIAADSRIQYGQIKSNQVSRIFRPFLDNYCQRQT